MYINTNLSALNSHRQLYNSNLSLDKSLERLSSGLRINTGADDASGLAIAEKMRAQNVGLATAIQNTQDGSSFFKIADGSMDQVSRILSRVEELLVRANNRTLTDNDRLTIQAEITQLVDQIDVTAKNTEYNTLKFMDGSIDIKKSLTMNTGVNGSVKILDTPGSVKTSVNAVLSITAVASPALAEAAVAPFAGQIGIQNTVNVNGVDVQISSADTISTIISKINLQNSKTNVVAIQTNTGTVGLISGHIDDDAKNVVDGLAGDTTKNASAVGYTLVGSSYTINIAGDNNIWNAMGFTPPVSNFFASGTNVAGNLAGIAMQGSGSVLDMQDSGSQLYGIKIATNMFNDAYGGFILTGPGAGATVATSYRDISAANDEAVISTDDSKKTAFQLGANYNQNIAYTVKSMLPENLGVGASSKIASLRQISVLNIEDANLSLKVVHKAITDVTSIRADIGATLNRLEYTEKTLRIQRENMVAAESKIRDADMAMEMTMYTRNQILAQTGTAMLAQANSRPQSVLQLLK